MTDRQRLARLTRRRLAHYRVELRLRDQMIARLAKQAAELQLRGHPADMAKADVRDVFIRTYVATLTGRWKLWGWAKVAAVAGAMRRFRVSRATVENALRYRRERDRGEKEPGVMATTRAFVEAVRRFTSPKR